MLLYLIFLLIGFVIRLKFSFIRSGIVVFVTVGFSFSKYCLFVWKMFVNVF